MHRNKFNRLLYLIICLLGAAGVSYTLFYYILESVPLLVMVLYSISGIAFFAGAYAIYKD